MSNLIKGTHHIAIKCEDEAMFVKALSFYSNVLGMDIIRQWGEGSSSGAMAAAGNCTIEIFASGRTSGETGSVNHFALATDNVDGCIEAVRSAGYKVTVEPKDIVIGSVPPLPARIGFCVGPAGEEIEFFNEK